VATRPYPPLISQPYVVYRSRRLPRAFVAGVFSALVPGAGQLYAGATRRGLAMLAIALGLCVLAVGFALQESVSLLRLAVQPDALLALLVADALLLLFRAHCALDAYRRARRERVAAGRPSGPSGGRAIAVLVLLAVVAIPHVYVGYLDWRSYDVLTTVFADDEPGDLGRDQVPEWVTAPGASTSAASSTAGASPSPTSLSPISSPLADSPSPAPTAPGKPLDGRPDEGAASAGTPPGESTQPAAEPPAPWDGLLRVTFLLVGADAGPYRYGLRTDTMIVVSIDPRTRRTAVFGIPRNLYAVPFPPSARTELETFPDLLNALWGYAEHNPDLFPGAKRPGATALKETIGHLLGLRIDYLAGVDLRGFVEVVDALGGVTVNVQRHVWDAGVSPPIEGEPSIAIDLAPGRHHLDGRQALAYSRTRWASSDYDRMHRQRCLLGALSRQASVVRLLRSLPELATTVKRFVFTDIPLKTLPDLVELLAGLDTRKMVGVSFAPPNFDVTLDGWDQVSDVERIRQTVRRALTESPKLDPEIGLQTLKLDCA
jgi:polyisoprenyl-teichoic acid--peptidoglycan teichoic acid transferase